MKLLAGGCSLIYGAELPDTALHYSKLTYPALLSKHFDFEYVCVANPGDGNDAIFRKVIEATNDEIGFVVVNWSYHDRFEFHHNTHGWQSLRYTNVNFKDEFATLAKTFYASLTEIYSWPKYVQSIILLQNFLLDKNIPFIFSSSDDDFFDSSNPITVNPYYQKLLALIDFNRWFYWTDTNGKKIGFNNWAKIQNYPLGPGNHPLELAHYKTFELVKDQIKELS